MVGPGGVGAGTDGGHEIIFWSDRNDSTVVCMLMRLGYTGIGICQNSRDI